MEVEPAVVTEVLQIQLQGGNCVVLWWCPSFLSLCKGCEGARKKLQSTRTCLHFPLFVCAGCWGREDPLITGGGKWWPAVGLASALGGVLLLWSNWEAREFSSMTMLKLPPREFLAFLTSPAQEQCGSPVQWTQSGNQQLEFRLVWKVLQGE